VQDECSQRQDQGARKDSRTSIRKTVTAPLPLGVQVLAAANREALAVALAVGATFVRVENFVYAHVADEGLMPVADAGPLLRYRRQIGADHVKILADVKKKHSSHALTAERRSTRATRSPPTSRSWTRPERLSSSVPTRSLSPAALPASRRRRKTLRP